MLILSSVKWQLKIIGIFPISKNDLPIVLQPYQLTINWIHMIIVIFSLFTYQMGTLMFFLYEAKTFAEYTDSGLYSTAAMLDISVYSILIWKRSELLKVFNRLERIISIRIRVTKILAIYSQENEKSEKFAQSVWNVILICVEFIIFPLALLSFYLYYTSNSNGTTSFRQVFPATVPWDWRVPTGYLYLIGLQFVWLNCALSVVACSLSLFVGCCILLTSLALDVKERFIDLRESIIASTSSVEPLDKLKDIIQFHSDAEDIVGHFSTVCKSMVTTFLGISTTLLCATFLGLDVALKNEGTVVVLRTISCLIIVLNIPLVLCFNGDNVSTKFEEINDVFDDCGWYDFPLNMQKLLPHMLMMIQKPVFIGGYMNTHCTRDVFKTITKTGFSYFTMLRKSK